MPDHPLRAKPLPEDAELLQALQQGLAFIDAYSGLLEQQRHRDAAQGTGASRMTPEVGEAVQAA